ncbi:MAG: hypothetical protein BWY02_02065 [bacterium ADurb.Bin157]|nr:MAG: hypothetical protein BWY02_02065 [bacterium ADurb.Bin157]
MTIESYLNANLPVLYTANFSMIEGNQQFDGPDMQIERFDDSVIEILDWDTLNVDITKEVGIPQDGKITIHTYFENQLVLENDFVFYDHTQGEIADYITFKENDDHIKIGLYHCKASGKESAGTRAEDYYEVCSQTVKSTRWAGDIIRLRDHIAHRDRDVERTRFCGSGNLDELDNFLEQTKQKTKRFWITIIQPGISSSNFGPYAQLLTSAQNYIRRSRGHELALICSA